MQDFMKLAKAQIAAGKPARVVNKSLDTYYRQEHKNDFYIAQKAVYDGLFPEYEYQYGVAISVVENDTTWVIFQNHNDLEVYTYDVRRRLEHSVTYEEYRDETIVVTEAVEATYDEDGMPLIEEVLEVTGLTKPYVAIEDVSLQVTEYLSTMAITFREIEYGKLNQDEMRFDDTVNGTTIWVDTIKAIKIKYPKV